MKPNYTIRIQSADDENVEFCLDLRPYDRIVWRNAGVITDEDGAEVGGLYVAEFYKTHDLEGDVSMTITVDEQQKEEIISLWEKLRNRVVVYSEDRSDHAAKGSMMLHAVEDDGEY